MEYFHCDDALEFISYIEHSVGAVCVELLGGMREFIGALAARGTVVAAALLVTSGDNRTVVQDVAHHEVDGE